MKAFLISGDRSGSGKTSITLAIAAALSKNHVVQTFKVGMDYIDPSYLTGVTGRFCRNLDTFVMTGDEISATFDHACIGADIAIIEGVRGLYEGAESIADTGSTASVAKLLDIPVIVVIDARSITRSAAALLLGFMRFDPEIRITGVILNNVRGEKHIRKATEAIRHYCNIPVIGAVPRYENLDLTMRHLGLVPFEEGIKDQPFLQRVEDIIGTICSHLDLGSLLSVAADLNDPKDIPSLFAHYKSHSGKIGIARDEAFNFYYADLFSLIGSAGYEIAWFSPVHGDLPDADGYILGGGYPEYFGKELSGNAAMLEDIRGVCTDNRPVLAECGGLMYLCREICITKNFSGLNEGDRFPLAGVLPACCSIPERRVVTYVTGKTTPTCPYNPDTSLPLRGHAFHYSTIHPDSNAKYAFFLNRGTGIAGDLDGLVSGETIGSYTHLHPVASRDFLYSFLSRCRT